MSISWNITGETEFEFILKTNSHVIKDGVWSIRAREAIGPRSGADDLQCINMDEALSLCVVLIQSHLHTCTHKQALIYLSVHFLLKIICLPRPLFVFSPEEPENSSTTVYYISDQDINLFKETEWVRPGRGGGSGILIMIISFIISSSLHPLSFCFCPRSSTSCLLIFSVLFSLGRERERNPNWWLVREQKHINNYKYGVII